MAFTDLHEISDMFSRLIVAERAGLEAYATRIRHIDNEQKRAARKAKSSHRVRCEGLALYALSEAARATVARVREAHEQELANLRERQARYRASPQGKRDAAERRASRTEWMRRKRAGAATETQVSKTKEKV